MTRARNAARRAGWWGTDRAATHPARPASLDDIEIAHGWTRGEVARLARAATRICRSRLGELAERRDIAAFAIVEALLTTPAPPAERDLVFAAVEAIKAESAAELRRDGVYYRDGAVVQARGFERYWSWHSANTGSAEGPVVERHAARQIWAALTQLQRDTVELFADHGFSISRAAEAAGVAHGTFASRLRLARTGFLTSWHEGETPRGQWRKDVTRATDDRHGTSAGYQRHTARHEPACEPCREAWRAYSREWKARRKASSTDAVPEVEAGLPAGGIA